MSIPLLLLASALFGNGAVRVGDGLRTLGIVLGGLAGIVLTGGLFFLTEKLSHKYGYKVKSLVILSLISLLVISFHVSAAYEYIDVDDQTLMEYQEDHEGELAETQKEPVRGIRDMGLLASFVLTVWFYIDVRRKLLNRTELRAAEFHGLAVLFLFFALLATLVRLRYLSNIFLLFGFGLHFIGGAAGFVWRQAYSRVADCQMLLLDLLLAVFWISQIFSPFADYTQGECIAVGTVALITNVLLWGWRYGKETSWQTVKRYWEKNWPVWLIIGVFLMMSLETLDDYYKWDSYYYKLQVMENRQFDFTFVSFLRLNLVGHLCSGFSVFAATFSNLTGNVDIACRLVNLFLGSVTIYCYYGLLRGVLHEKSRILISVYTMIFAFSPWLLGVVGEVSLDYASLCFFVWLIYFIYMKYDILTLFGSFLLCFSKEPGIVLCAGCVLGVYIWNVIFAEKSRNLLLRAWHAIWHKNIWAPGFPICVWMFEYMLTSHWGAEDSFHYFGIQPVYILKKTVTMLVLNFNWAWGFLIAAAVLVILRRRALYHIWDSNRLKLFLPLLGATAFFVGFSLLFVTYNHPRYILPYEFPLTLLGTLAVLYLCGTIRWKAAAVTGIAVIQAVQSFYTIDPLSLRVFDNLPVGRTSIITTNWIEKCHNFGDSTVYNRQYSYLEKAMDKALAMIEYDRNKVVLLSSPFGIVDSYTPESVYYSLFGGLTVYWDEENQKRSIVNTGNWAEIQYELVRTATKEKMAGKELYYFSFPWIEDEVEEDYFEIIERSETEYRGWVIGIWKLRWR
ncbi:MAG: hypothetical protein HFI38_09980 [Lachnospiraceae bacterium]|nr:hypothetical protein [Lachnospiraceae bacterium]